MLRLRHNPILCDAIRLGCPDTPVVVGKLGPDRPQSVFPAFLPLWLTATHQGINFLDTPLEAEGSLNRTESEQQLRARVVVRLGLTTHIRI